MRRYFRFSKDRDSSIENHFRSKESAREHLDVLEDLSGLAHVVRVNFDPSEDLLENGESIYFMATTYFDDGAAEFIAWAQDVAFSHALISKRVNDLRYSDEYFYDMMIDKGYVQVGRGLLTKYCAYCRLVGEQKNTDTTETVFCNLGIRGKNLVGCERMKLPFNHLAMEFFLRIIEENLQRLLLLANMDQLELLYTNLHGVLFHHHTNESTNITRFIGHTFICWNFKHLFFTCTELKLLLKRFDQFFMDKLCNLPKCADVPNIYSTT